MASKTIAVPKGVQTAVKTEIYDALREGLTKPASASSKKSWAQDFIAKMLSEAKKNPNGPLGQMIARQIMQDDILSSLDEATDRYLSRDLDFNEYRLMKTLYHEQQEVFNDGQNNRIICIGSRRIGKSELAARLLLKDALKPGHSAIYININHQNAIKQCFKVAEPLAQSLGMSITKSSENDGLLEFSNGSVILFKGNPRMDSADTFQGNKYSLAVIDEVQNEVNLQYLINTILSPTIDRDYENGQIICLGTPPRVPHTYCERIWKELKGWKHYGWDMSKNPFLKGDTEKIIKNRCEEMGCTPDAPFIQREYKGDWVYDMEARVYKNPLFYEGGTEYVKKLIAEKKFKADYVYGGIDWGGTDYNAIVTVAWDKARRIGYILDHYKFNQSTATEIITKCRQSLEESLDILSISGSDLHNVTYYADHNVKSLVFELSNNYNFPIELAYKHDKIPAISILADLLRTHIYTPKDSPLADEYEMVVYKRDQETDAILPELDDDTYHQDAADALLYASRAIVQFENPLGDSLSVPEEQVNVMVNSIPDEEKDFTD